jgi:hypothetical protein
MQQFPQYRLFLQDISAISQRFSETFLPFSGCIFGLSEGLILSRKPIASGETKLLVEALAKKLQDDCSSPLLVRFK